MAPSKPFQEGDKVAGNAGEQHGTRIGIIEPGGIRPNCVIIRDEQNVAWSLIPATVTHDVDGASAEAGEFDDVEDDDFQDEDL